VPGGFNVPAFSGKPDASALAPTRLGKLPLDIGVDLHCPLACFAGKTRLEGSLNPGAGKDVRDVVRHATDVLKNPVSRGDVTRQEHRIIFHVMHDVMQFGLCRVRIRANWQAIAITWVVFASRKNP